MNSLEMKIKELDLLLRAVDDKVDEINESDELRIIHIVHLNENGTEVQLHKGLDLVAEALNYGCTSEPMHDMFMSFETVSNPRYLELDILKAGVEK